MSKLQRLWQFKPAIANNIIVDKSNGCWLWQGFVMANGYAYFGGKRAHRTIYQFFNEDLTQKQHLHHICEIKHCVNPDHLQKIDSAAHNRYHQVGRALTLSEEERKRRREHGRAMIHHATERSYTKRSRSEVSKETWSKRTPEQRAEIGRKISATKRGDA
jgi:hypothetical protein